MQLSDIIATEQLLTRTGDGKARAATPRTFPHGVPDADGETLRSALRARCEEAMLRCSAQSAGISIFDGDEFDELTWVAATGVMAQFEGSRFPRANSLCGVCFSYRATQLFIQPHRYFNWMGQAGIEINEGLVVPLIGQFGAFYGTIWVMSHDDHHIHFDLDDAQSLADLSRGLATTIRLHDFARGAAERKI